MALTHTSIVAAKPTDKPYSLADGKGLSLLVQPTGAKWWRLRYRFDGKAKMLSVGVYPDVSLKDARERRDDARRLLANDIDPGANRKIQKAAKQDRAANSFEVVAREWFTKQATTWTEGHATRIIRRLERDIFPWLGGKPIAGITAPEVRAAIQRIETRGAIETAHRALTDCELVFRYAAAHKRATRDICSDLRDLRKTLTPVKSGHMAAVTKSKDVAGLLRTLDGYQGTLTVMCALKLAPLVFVRPGELRAAQWADIDLDAAEWSYLVTKTKTDHIVPLSTQAVEILREIQALTGQGRYVFPSARTRDRPMSDNAILAAMRRLGIPADVMTGHGFRAMARTILDEVLGFRVDIIEHQLAHAVKDANGTAYNRTTHLPARREMMQRWSDYLDSLKAGADVVPIRRTA